MAILQSMNIYMNFKYIDVSMRQFLSLNFETKHLSDADRTYREAKVMYRSIYITHTQPACLRCVCHLIHTTRNYRKLIQKTLKILEELLHLSENIANEILVTVDFNGKIGWESFDPRAKPRLWNVKLLVAISKYCLLQNVDR